MVGNDVYDTGFQVTEGQWSQVAVAWNPDLDLMTVYHVTDQTTMDYKRFTVTNMTCFEDGGVMTVGKWRQPNTNANHPPTQASYLGEVDEVSLSILVVVTQLVIGIVSNNCFRPVTRTGSPQDDFLLENRKEKKRSKEKQLCMRLSNT